MLFQPFDDVLERHGSVLVPSFVVTGVGGLYVCSCTPMSIFQNSYPSVVI